VGSAVAVWGAAEAHILQRVAAAPQIHIGEKLGEEHILLALELPVGHRLPTRPVSTDDGGLREEMMGVNVIKVGMG
jgi:hypothetical protein